MSRVEEAPSCWRTDIARVWFAILGVALLVGLASPQTASAQESEATILVQVKQQNRTAEGRADNQPIAGVSITVLDSTGAEVGAGTTDADGKIAIDVPDRGDYVVRLDESTLPEGQALSPQTPSEQQVADAEFVTSTKVVNFFTGENQRTSTSRFEQISQRISDGLRLGLVLAMCSVGLSLIFGTTGLTNFAHGEMVTFGALFAWWVNSKGVHIFFAAIVAVAAGAVLGWALDKFAFARYRDRGFGLIPQMVITLGMSIAAKNLFQWRFGTRDKPYFNYTNQVGIKLGVVTITPRDLIVTVLSAVVLVAVAVTLQYSRLGKATRAVSDNPALASSTGIDSERIIRIVWVVGAALAALGGIFRGLDEQVQWDLGSTLLFLMFAAITLGGLGSAFGALLGGIVVGLLVECSVLFGVPTELKAVPALVLLVLILLVRPQGILGRSQRVG